ncbi:hypothetical protein FB451DRAFT_1395245 [Mycena latifolia]|nr:hypothetical protein FB451DRAFT_1395245 [Mycena latifolia]
MSSPPPPYEDVGFEALITALGRLEVTVAAHRATAAARPQRAYRPPRANITHSTATSSRVPSTTSTAVPHGFCPATPTSASASHSEPLYRYQSPTQSGYTSHWDEAAQATQDIPGGSPQHLTPRKNSRAQHKRAAYVVFFGCIPGIYFHCPLRDDVKPNVLGVHGSLYQGYMSQESAQAAYEYACHRSWTRVCGLSPRSPSLQQAPMPALPSPVSTFNAPNPLHFNGDDGRWYVVYCGITPGVYQSSLEYSLNTVRLSCMVYDSWSTRKTAIAHYQAALDAGYVKVLCPPSYWYLPLLYLLPK